MTASSPCREGMSEGMSERYVGVVCRGYVGGYVRSLRQTGVPRGCRSCVSQACCAPQVPGYVGRVCRKGRRHNTVKLVPRAQMVPDVCRQYVGQGDSVLACDHGMFCVGCQSLPRETFVSFMVNGVNRQCKWRRSSTMLTSLDAQKGPL